MVSFSGEAPIVFNNGGLFLNNADPSVVLPYVGTVELDITGHNGSSGTIAVEIPGFSNINVDITPNETNTIKFISFTTFTINPSGIAGGNVSYVYKVNEII